MRISDNDFNFRAAHRNPAFWDHGKVCSVILDIAIRLRKY
jgi:hypothetical protein